jgi:PAS domain S-box-containing protein
MKSQKQRPSTSWPLILLFLIISSVAIIVGSLQYRNEKKHLLENSRKELSSVADLKARQIVQWRQERLADGLFLSRNSVIRQHLKSLIYEGHQSELTKILRNDLSALVKSYDYKNALFIDTEMNVKLFYPDQDTVIGDYLRMFLPEIFKKGDVVLTDIHQTGKVSFIHLDLLVPLRNITGRDSSIFGMLVLRIDPKKVLWPLVQSWPVTSKSAETLLFHLEGEEIVYLNQLRHIKNTDFVLRKSVNEKNLPAAMALRGITETSDGIDYRGVKVIASMNKVPDTKWYMVSKIDKAEVLANLDGMMTRNIVIIILVILTTGSFLGFMQWNQRVRFYREKYENELDRLALVSHFDYILKYANDIILLADKDYNIIEANDRAIETYQYDRIDLIGKNLKELRADSTKDQFESDRSLLLESGFLTFETIHKRRDGTTFPIEISGRQVTIEGMDYYQSISRNITERKMTEETLKESETRFRKIFEESPFCIAMTGKDLVILKANEAFCRMIGYSEEELHGMTFKNFSHPDHITLDSVGMLRLIAKEIPVYKTEKKYIKRDGSIIWGSTTVTIIRNERDEVLFLLAMVEDITLRKLAESELVKSFSLQKATLESTADGILVVDSNGKIVQYNQKFADMWRIPIEVLIMKDDAAAIKYVLDQLKYPERFVEKVRKLYSDPGEITYDLLEFKDDRYFERYSQPQKIGGDTVGRVWSFRDITERKKAESELIAAKEKAEEGDKLKTAFLHNVSHEIRTPMNAILGFSTLLNEPDLSEADRKQFISVIFQSGNQLLSIINDIVDVATIESGQVKVNLKQVNLNDLLRRLSEQFSYKQKQYEIILTLKTPLPGKDAEIITDSTKLVQILSNLINNAFKFSKKGRIGFGYALTGTNLEFFVKDTGIGIPAEHHSKIFERFYQVESAASRQFAGTGLGLSICKAYVELLGGKIWLASEPGKGTQFYFTIPYVIKEEKTV